MPKNIFVSLAQDLTDRWRHLRGTAARRGRESYLERAHHGVFEGPSGAALAHLLDKNPYSPGSLAAKDWEEAVLKASR